MREREKAGREAKRREWERRKHKGKGMEKKEKERERGSDRASQDEVRKWEGNQGEE